MVFEAIVTNLLNRYLGNYVENLDGSQMKLSIWSGNVQLKNLVLKQNALDELNLPVKVKSGCLSNLSLSIPWSNLYSAPVVASLDGIHLLAVPNSSIKYDPVAEQNSAREAKRKLIADFEARVAADNSQPSDASKQDSFSEKLAAQIVRNVQISISNVHIRYEDDSTSARGAFAVGLLMRGVHVQSTGADWQPTDSATDTTTAAEDSHRHFFKLVKLDSLAVYFNTHAQMVSHSPPSMHQQLMSSDLDACLSTPGHCQFMLAPIVLETRLRIDPKPEVDNYVEPKVTMSSDMQSLDLSVSRAQFGCLMEMLHGLERLSVAAVFRKYRPAVPLRGHARTWWVFAYQCVLNEVVRRRRLDWSWHHMHTYVTMIDRYHTVYKKKLGGNTLSVDDVARLDDYEFKLNIVSIITVRQRVQAEVGQDRRRQQLEARSGWFGGWFRSGRGGSTEVDSGGSLATQLRSAITDEERDKLYSAIDYHERGGDVQLPADFEAVRLRFRLARLTVSVLESSADACCVLQARAELLDGSFAQRPAVSGVRVQLALNTVTAEGLSAGRGQQPVIMSSDVSDHSEESPPLFSLQFESSQSEAATAVSRLTLATRAAQLVYDAATFNRLADVFQAGASAAAAGDQPEQLRHLQAAAASKLLELKESSALKMQHVIESSAVFECDVQLTAPRLLVPEAGDISREGAVLAVTLGHLCVRSVPRSTDTVSVSRLVSSGSSSELIYQRLAEHSYDWFDVKLSDVAAVVAASSEASAVVRQHAQQVADLPAHMCLVQPISLSLKLGKCLIRDDARLPLTKTLLNVPLLEVRVSDFRLAQLTAVLDSLQKTSGSGGGGGGGAAPDVGSASVTRGSIVPSHTASVPLDNLSVSSEAARATSQQQQQQSPSQPSANQLVDLQMSFELQQFSLRVFTNETMHASSAERQVADLCVVGLATRVNKTEQTMKVECSVSDVCVRSLEFNDTQGRGIVLLGCSPDANQSLLRLNYESREGRAVPSTETHEDTESSARQTVRLAVASVDVTMHQQAMLSLTAVCQRLQSSLQQQNSQWSSTNASSSSATAGRSRHTVTSTDLASSRRSVRALTAGRRVIQQSVGELLLLAELEMSGLRVSLVAEQLRLLESSVQGMSVTVQQRRDHTRMAASLQRVTVEDRACQHAHCTTVLSVAADPVFQAEIELFSRPAHQPAPAQLPSDHVDVAVKVRAAGARVMLLSRFVADVAAFFAPFSSQRHALAGASQSMAEAAQTAVHSAYSTPVVRLDVVFKAPLIIVPQSAAGSAVLAVDLGLMSVNNHSSTTPAGVVHDNIVCRLDDVKMVRACVSSDGGELTDESVVLAPVSFALDVVRRVNATTNDDGADLEVTASLGQFLVTLDGRTLAQVMRTLSGNLAEPTLLPTHTSDDRRPVQHQQQQHEITADCHVTYSADVQPSQESRVETAASVVVSFGLRWSFVGVDLLHAPPSSAHDCAELAEQQTATTVPLSRFCMHQLNVQGRVMSDSRLECSVRLDDCEMRDTRPHVNTQFRRLLHKSDECRNANSDEGSGDSPELVSIKLSQSRETGRVVDVVVRSVTVVLHLPYFVSLGEFFSLNMPAPDDHRKPTAGSHAASSSGTRRPTVLAVPSSQQQQQQQQDSMTELRVLIERPDVLVVEDVRELDTRALVFHAQVQLLLKQVGTDTSLQTSLDNVRLFTCRQQQRAQTCREIVSQFGVTVTGGSRETGTNIDVSISEVSVHVNAAAINLLSAISVSVAGSGSSETSESPVKTASTTCPLVDRSSLWNTQHVSELELDFLGSVDDEVDEAGVDALLALTDEVDTCASVGRQMIVLKVAAVRVTVEETVGRACVPLVLLESRLQAVVRDWSARLAVEAVVAVEARYFNSRLSVWEPLIERVSRAVGAHTSELVPLELLVAVHRNTELLSLSSPVSQCSQISAGDEAVNLPLPALSINVSTSVPLQLTVTRTCLDILLSLQESLASAMQLTAGGPSSAVSDAQLVIRNRLHERVTVVPGAGYRFLDQQVDQVLLDHACHVELVGRDAAVSAASDSLSIYVEIASLNWHGDIPINRAEPRFFRLRSGRANSSDETVGDSGGGGGGGGFIADIQVQRGCRVVTLRSFVEVQNNLQIPVTVYHHSSASQERLVSDTVVQPGQRAPLSLAAVTSNLPELFFSCGVDYTVTAQPFAWRPLLVAPSLNRVLTCERRGGSSAPATDGESAPASLCVVCDGRVLPVLFEGTRSRTITSRSLLLTLRPFALLNNLLPVPVMCVFDGRDEDDGSGDSVPPGTSRHLPSARPGLTVTLRIDNYLGRRWSASQKLQSQPAAITVWNFVSTDDQRCVQLALGVHTVVVDGSLQMSLYAPFWMVNQTGRQLTYQPAGSGDENTWVHHPADYSEPIMFSFEHKQFFSKKKICVRVDDSQFSDSFSLDSVGSSGRVECAAAAGQKQRYTLSVQISSRSGLTRQVLLLPGFVVLNNAPFDVELGQCASQDDCENVRHWTLVPSEQCLPVWPASHAQRLLFVCRVRDCHTDTLHSTAAFSCDSTMQCLLPLASHHGGVHVDVQVSEWSTSLTLAAYEDGMAAVRVVNDTRHWHVTFGQQGVQKRHTLRPRETRLFGWPTPSSQRLLSWSCAGHQQDGVSLTRDDVADFGVAPELTDDDGGAAHISQRLYCVSFLHGKQRTLVFTADVAVAVRSQNAVELERIDSQVSVQLESVGVSLVNDVARCDVLYLGISSSGVLWEGQKQGGRRFRPLSQECCAALETAYAAYLTRLSVDTSTSPAAPVNVAGGKLDVDFDTMIMRKPLARRLRRTFLSGVWLQLSSSQHHRQLHVKLHRLQLDNQLVDCVFPVVVSQVQLPPSVVGDSGPRPFLEVSVVERMAAAQAGVTQFKYFKMLMQEFHIKLDHGFLRAVLAFFNSDGGVDRLEMFAKDMSDVTKPLCDRVALRRQEQVRHFYDYLHFSPIKVHVSFSMTGGGGGGENEQQPGGAGSQLASGFLELLLQSVGVTITEIQDVVFKLAYFERRYVFLGNSDLLAQVQTHYVGQAIKQLYVLILGLDVIGNPFGLVVGLKEGVSDLFYEPVQGAIQGPGEFAEGLALGVKSLLSHAVGDTAASVSRITGTLGKGIAALTLDDEYKRRRREQLSRQPTNLAAGLARSGHGLVMGVFDGVSGVIMKPIEGAQEGGTLGFVKGVGVGVAGLFVRPVSGVVDFASGSLNAVRRSVDAQHAAQRLRPARHFRADGVLRPYIRHEAEGAAVLHQLDKGRYTSTDQYVAHCTCTTGRHQLLLLTDLRLLLVNMCALLGNWQTNWTLMLRDMPSRASVTLATLNVPLQAGKQGLFQLFGKSAANKQIPLADSTTANWMLAKINEAIDQMK